eukprot:618841-Amphidinium_carterae.2
MSFRWAASVMQDIETGSRLPLAALVKNILTGVEVWSGYAIRFGKVVHENFQTMTCLAEGQEVEPGSGGLLV